MCKLEVRKSHSVIFIAIPFYKDTPNCSYRQLYRHIQTQETHSEHYLWMGPSKIYNGIIAECKHSAIFLVALDNPPR